MKKKIVWLVVSCSMVAALLLASCGQAVEEEEVAPAVEEEEVAVEEEVVPAAAEVEMVEWTGTKADGTVVEKRMEKPKYGGVLVLAGAASPVYFDDAHGHPVGAPTLKITNDALMSGDWAKGPAGTGETTWVVYSMPSSEVTEFPMLCESWERTDPSTYVYHIRKGIHFHDKPPTNGREMDAYDVAFSLNRNWDSVKSYPHGAHPKEQFVESIEATDKWTVVCKAVDCQKALTIHAVVGWHISIFPPEAIEEYGDLGDWRNSVGTGPFLLADYTTDSSVTFERNPNYWRKHPIFSEDTMPYLDGIKWLIIPDISTRQAAMRTGKIDRIGGLTWEDAKGFMESNPELEYFEYPGYVGTGIHLRVDKPELPTHDVRVRQALAMALDNELIRDTYYSGRADLLTFPTGKGIKEYESFYIPLEDMPQSVREQFEYHPDKAKQLLAEAGYPDGFKTTVVCHSVGPTHVELLSIAKDSWAEIGVELEIDVKEYAVHTGMSFSKSYPEHIMNWTIGSLPETHIKYRQDNLYNQSMVDDPYCNEVVLAMEVLSCDVDYDYDERDRIMRGIVPYVLEQAYIIQFPAPWLYTFWHPWLKGYHGENEVGWIEYGTFQLYVWIDQDLKEEMTGRR